VAGVVVELLLGLVLLSQVVLVVLVVVVFVASIHGDKNEQPIRNHRKQCCC
jgi:hypothetical protein